MLVQSGMTGRRPPRLRRCLAAVALCLLPILGADGFWPALAAAQPRIVLTFTVPDTMALNTQPGYPGLTAGTMPEVQFDGFQVRRLLSPGATISVVANDNALRDNQGESIPIGQLEIYRDASAGAAGFVSLSSTTNQNILVLAGTFYQTYNFSVRMRMRLTGLETASLPGDPYHVVLTFTATD